MEDALEILRATTSNCEVSAIDNIPFLNTGDDPFATCTNEMIMIGAGFILVDGGKKLIRRVFVQLPGALAYRCIGWVVDDDVTNCMICAVRFYFWDRKHHCRICGDIICNSCSNGEVIISEFRELGVVRACDCCYFGQVRVTQMSTISRLNIIKGRNIHLTTPPTPTIINPNLETTITHATNCQE
jgi:hypothetical protein